jgi:hypothetical protein
VLLATLPGCAAGRPKVVRVAGKVTRAGQPVPNLFLTFLPAQGRPSWGVTSKQGLYKLHYDPQLTGAVTGVHTVFVCYKPRNAAEEKAMAEGLLKPPPHLAGVLEKYGHQETSPLRIEINRDDQVINLELD